MILEEYDDLQEAIFNPTDVVANVDGCPSTIIVCFAHDLIAYAAVKYEGEVIARLSSANGEEPLYKLKDKDLGLYMAVVGAPSTVAGFEELFAMGAKRILVFGTCGVLDKGIEDCSIIIPNIAVRDEGTSYHYAEGSDEINVNVHTLDTMMQFFDEIGVHYTVGKVWTTDAIYRETRAKMEKRRADGCICVDMECSAIAALAKFRDKPISQFFYSADNLDNDVWEKRNLKNEDGIDVKQKIMDLAISLSEKL